MKRYMALILEILRFTERQCGDEHMIQPPEIDGYTPRQVHYHVGLCGEAGYLHVQASSKRGEFFIQSLTWQGHEELDKHRNGARS
ncbi:MAG: DUF2513 domain-containing protein [Chloroflexi bacterium]|nr:DUF2513 domain-containing protein [Chloroflexota bacterium]